MKSFSSIVCAFACWLAVPVGAQAQNSDPTSPIPDYYSEGGFASHRDQLASEDVEERIDPFSGRVVLNHTDIAIPGNGGLELRVTRAYNNAQLGVINQSDMGAMGLGWDVTFGRVLLNPQRGVCEKTINGAMNSSTNHVFQLPDGSRQVLYPADLAPFSSYTFVTTSRWVATCTQAPEGQGLIITSPDGLQYHMTKRRTSGFPALLVAQIRDRNDNTIDIEYKTVGGPLNATVISEVSTSDGRSLVFNYSNETTMDYALASIRAGTRIWRYNYEAVTGFPIPTRFLTEAERPDGLSWKYTYYPDLGLGDASSYSLHTMTYPRGAKATYTYQNVGFGYAQQSSVIATKQISGTDMPGGTWEYQFTSSSTYDQTRVTAPNGTRYFYRHVGYLAAASNSSRLWSVGTLLYKAISSSGLLHVETYTWDQFRISSQRLVAAGHSTVFNDAGVYVPLSRRRVIQRDGDNFETEFTNFDAYGNPQRIVEFGTAGSRSATLTYHNNTARYVIGSIATRSVGNISGQISYSYDANSNLTRINQYGVETEFTHTASGDIASRKDARGNTTSYSNYKRGIAQAINAPEGVSLRKSVSDAGAVTSVRDGNLHTTSYDYNELNKPTFINYPIHASVSIDWNKNSIRVERGGYVEVTTLDGLGRPTKINRNGIAVSYEYDALGRRTFVSYPCPATQSCPGRTYAYDAFGRTTRVNNNGAIRNFTFGRDGWVTILNERNFQTQEKHEAYGDPGESRIRSIQTPTMRMAVVYNAIGAITQITQVPWERTFQYNAKQFLTSMVDPEVGTTTFGRDAVGNMISRKVGSAASVTYQYDNLDRQTVVSDVSGVLSTTTYDAASNIKTVSSRCTRITYGYDEMSHLTSEQHQDLCGGPTLAVSYTYNNLDQPESMTYPSGRIVQFAPDPFGRPTRAGNYVTSATYHPNGIPRVITYGNGVTEEQSLTPRQLISRVIARASGAAPFVDYTYAYDNANNVTQITDAVMPSNTMTAQYDEDDQLIAASGSFGSGGVTYDGRGNITQLSLGVGRLFSFSYVANRLVSVTGSKAYNVMYDNQGNVTYDGEYRYTYDSRNLLISARP